MRRASGAVVMAGAFALAAGTGSAQEEPAGPAAFAGTWRATIETPGGELPFTVELRSEAGGVSAFVVNGAEQARFDSVALAGRRICLRFDVYDSEIEAELSADGKSLAGAWKRPGRAPVAFAAARGDRRRFLPLAGEAVAPTASVGGAWAASFGAGDKAQPARGELTQRDGEVQGTFLTPLGDHRYLDGDFRGGTLRLSRFDGGNASLYVARLQPDGSLAGELWRGPGAATPWTARRVDPAGSEGLKDSFALAGLANAEGRLRFAFPDLEGRLVSLADERFHGRVVLVNIFGSWCPNCNDEAPLLREWRERYRERGFEVLGLAYEQDGGAERDRRAVERFARRHRLAHPLLLAGISERKAAAATLPDVTGLFAFPTTIFVDRQGRVRRIHSGFAGPATGVHHERLVAEMTRQIEELLAEPGPATAQAGSGSYR